MCCALFGAAADLASAFTAPLINLKKRYVYKAFAHCSLSDLAHEIFAAAGAPRARSLVTSAGLAGAPSLAPESAAQTIASTPCLTPPGSAPAPHALDSSTAQLVLPSLHDAQLTVAVLQRQPLVRAAGALVCTGSAESKRAWCSMLRDLFRASGAHVSDAVCVDIYLVCEACARRGHVQLSARASLHPFIERFTAHPALSLACPDPAFVAELTAHPLYCRASRSSVQRWEVMFRCRAPSQAHAQQWHEYGIDVGLKQRSTLLARAALCELLVLKLMRFGGACRVRYPQHHATCVVSRRHFFVSKNLAPNLFDEGQRLYGRQRFGDAAKSWGQAALLQHAHSHALLSIMLIEGKQDVRKDHNRAFEVASAGASMGCAHSKGALGLCYSAGYGVTADWAKAYALGRESAAASSCIGQHVVGVAFDFGRGVAQDKAEAVRWHRLAAAQGYALAQYTFGNKFCNGEGVAQDQAEAVQWWRVAAAQGQAQAQAALNRLGLKHNSPAPSLPAPPPPSSSSLLYPHSFRCASC
jgi:TPR repeat protein